MHINLDGSNCPDDDGDGVCNNEDECPGEDDMLDSDNNGVPDCLEEGNTQELTDCEGVRVIINSTNVSVEVSPINNNSVRMVKMYSYHSGYEEIIVCNSYPANPCTGTSTPVSISLENNEPENWNFDILYNNGAPCSINDIEIGGSSNSNCQPSDPCDDGDPCTINETFDANCQCTGGTPVADSDNDGVCDTIDQCPGVPDDANNNGTPDCQEGSDPCDSANVVADANSITVSNISVPRAIVKIFDKNNNYQLLFECNHWGTQCNISEDIDLPVGDYLVQLIYQDNEGNSVCNASIIEYDRTVGVNPIKIKNNRSRDIDLNLTPNPATDIVSMDLKAFQDKEVEISVYNLYGEKVHQETISKLNTNTHYLDTSEYINGLYTVYVRTSGYRPVNGKLVIARMY